MSDILRCGLDRNARSSSSPSLTSQSVTKTGHHRPRMERWVKEGPCLRGLGAQTVTRAWTIESLERAACMRAILAGICWGEGEERIGWSTRMRGLVYGRVYHEERMVGAYMGLSDTSFQKHCSPSSNTRTPSTPHNPNPEIRVHSINSRISLPQSTTKPTSHRCHIAQPRNTSRSPHVDQQSAGTGWTRPERIPDMPRRGEKR